MVTQIDLPFVPEDILAHVSYCRALLYLCTRGEEEEHDYLHYLMTTTYDGFQIPEIYSVKDVLERYLCINSVDDDWKYRAIVNSGTFKEYLSKLHLLVMGTELVTRTL